MRLRAVLTSHTKSSRKDPSLQISRDLLFRLLVKKLNVTLSISSLSVKPPNL